jgi:hypothetical protein
MKRSSCYPVTRGANAEQKHFVVFHDKPIGRCFLFLQGAAGKLKGSVAFAAMKMVVMPLSRTFI